MLQFFSNFFIFVFIIGMRTHLPDTYGSATPSSVPKGAARRRLPGGRGAGAGGRGLAPRCTHGRRHLRHTRQRRRAAMTAARRTGPRRDPHEIEQRKPRCRLAAAAAAAALETLRQRGLKTHRYGADQSPSSSSSSL